MSLSERTIAHKKHIQLLNDAGVRKTKFHAVVADSLRNSAGEAAEIRRAKAFAAILDKSVQVVLPYECLLGSVIGDWPVDSDAWTYERAKATAIDVIKEYIETKKSDPDGWVVTDGAVNYEAALCGAKHRFALMARDHYDGSIKYSDLQQVIRDVAEHFRNEDIEHYEIGRELERYFTYDYGAENLKLIAELPWNVANHVNLNYKKLVQKGFGAIRDDLENRFLNETEQDRRNFYCSVLISVEAAIRYIHRYAQTARQASAAERDAQRSDELLSIAALVDKVAEQKPETFYEAVQLIWLTHIMFSLEGGSALSFARFDQYLLPFYERDIQNNVIDRDTAKEILCCLWLKVNEPKMRTVQSMTLGGVCEKTGENACNALTKLCLEVTAEMKLPYPNVSLRVHSQVTPDWAYDAALEVIKTGIGHPMFLNDEVFVPNIMSLGYPPEYARDYFNMGCVELMIQGRQPNWSEADGIVLPFYFEAVLNKWNAGIYTLNTFEEFISSYLIELKAAIGESINTHLINYEKIRTQCYEPFASALVDGCIERGKDFFQGGPVCPVHIALAAYGLGTLADSLAAVKKFVYDEGRLSLWDLHAALKNNYVGYESLQTLLDTWTPAYGNDNDYVDEIAARVFQEYCNTVYSFNDAEKSEKYVNIHYSYNMHIYKGEITGATPNGRKRGEALSDTIGPSQGKDIGGPTKLINSVLKIGNKKITGAFALNLKVTPTLLKTEKGSAAVSNLVKAYLNSGGPQIQINVTDRETLKDAQVHPDKHRDLIVRVAGYCEYFVNLDEKLQSEIIKRTEHDLMV